MLIKAIKSSANADRKQRNIETGHMNTVETSYTDRAVAVHSEPPAPVIEAEREDLSAFFTVGIIINIVMVTAYFV